MGMFDDYYVNLECPICGHIQEYWQGKDGPCQLKEFHLGDAMYDYENVPIYDGVLGIHNTCGDITGATTTHWLDGLVIVHEGRWVASIVTKVSHLGSGSSGDLWNIREKE